MKFEQFQVAVIELASRGTRLTIANVVAAVRLEPAIAEQWLDEMAQSGRLDVELDESEGVVFYRVRGLSLEPREGWFGSAPIVPRKKRTKSAVVGALFGLLLPGIGIYAAPFSAAVLASLCVLVAVKMVGAIPLLGGLLSSIVLGIAALSSAALGAAYAKRYNLKGKREHLHSGDEADPKPYLRAMAANWS
jgi:hypothetical protein